MSHTVTEHPPIHGMMAEFETAEALVEAARAASAEGYHKMDAYSPLPHRRVTRCTAYPRQPGFAGLSDRRFRGSVYGFWAAELDVRRSTTRTTSAADRPMSVPMFIPITFECTILFAGLTTAIAMILMNGLPAPYHPVFNVERFSLASRSRFFLCIEAEDHHFDRDRTRKFLESLQPEEVSEVAH